MVFVNGQVIDQSDFIKKSSANTTPANDSGRVVKLESDGKLDPFFTRAGFGGTGLDGNLTITSGVTTISAAGADFIEKNYQNLSITGTASLAFSTPSGNGTLILIKVKGDLTLTSSSVAGIDARGMGGAGGSGGSPGTSYLSSPGSPGAWRYGTTDDTTAGQGCAGGPGAGGTQFSNSNYTFYNNPNLHKARKYIVIAAGSGGSGGSSGTGNLYAGGSGGNGGGAIIIEVAGAINFTGTINTSGGNGFNGGTGGTGRGAGGGAGGSAGMCFILYNTLTANSGTINASGGAGGASGATTSAIGNGGMGGSGGGSYASSGTVGATTSTSSVAGAAGGTGAGGGGAASGTNNGAGASGGAGGSSMGGFVIKNTIWA